MIGETLDWIARGRELVPKPDRRVLLSPPRLVARFAKFALNRELGHYHGSTADDIAARDPEFLEWGLRFFSAFGRRYFRVRTEGVDYVPATGPALLVANHSGGLVPIDGFFIGLSIFERFGGARAMYSLVHDFMFDDEVLRRYALKMGMLRATDVSAQHAFGKGHLVLVYPGGDWETFRPFRERGQIELGGRKGFVRLALRERVPIVPVVCAGSHEQFIVLTRGDKLARVVRAHKWARTDVMPIVFALPWGVTVGFVPYLPLPAQITISFLPAMSWPDLGPEAADDPAIVSRLYNEVSGAMQVELDRLDEGRHFLVGRGAS